jgi:starvation-inducible DNA-binding protein
MSSVNVDETKVAEEVLHAFDDLNGPQPAPCRILTELRDDNEQLTRFLRSAHELCARHNDVATTSLIEVWIDQTERRTWFLREIVSDL